MPGAEPAVRPGRHEGGRALPRAAAAAAGGGRLGTALPAAALAGALQVRGAPEGAGGAADPSLSPAGR